MPLTIYPRKTGFHLHRKKDRMLENGNLVAIGGNHQYCITSGNTSPEVACTLKCLCSSYPRNLEHRMHNLMEESSETPSVRHEGGICGMLWQLTTVNMILKKR